jgi:hypothetical protein
LVKLLDSTSSHIQLPAILAISRLLLTPNFRTQRVDQAGGIPPLVKLLSSASSDIQSYAVSPIAQLCGQSKFYGDLLAGYSKPMVGVLLSESRSCDFGSATSIGEVLYASTSSPYSSFDHRAHTLAEAGCVSQSIALLSSASPKAQCDALWALSYLCHFGEYARDISELGEIAVADSSSPHRVRRQFMRPT